MSQAPEIEKFCWFQIGAILKRHNSNQHAFRSRVPCGPRKQSENGTRGRKLFLEMEKRIPFKRKRLNV